MNHHEIALGTHGTFRNRGRPTLCRGVAVHGNLRIIAGELVGHFARGVGRTVVDHYHVEPVRQLRQNIQHALQSGMKGSLGIVDRNQNAQRRVHAFRL